MNATDPLVRLIADPGPTCTCCDLEDRAFCAGLTRDGLRGLRAIRGNTRAEPGQTVFREGDPAEHVFSLVRGTVKLSKLLGDGRRQIVGFLFPGDFFGFSLAGTYGYTAEAVTPTAFCRFPESRLRALMADAPELEARLLDRMIAELTFAQEQMLLLGRMTAREKIAHFLLVLSRRAEARGEPPSPLAVPMSRLDVADYLGLTIETVSRTISALKKDGLISLPSHNVVAVADFDGLRAIADGHAA